MCIYGSELNSVRDHCQALECDCVDCEIAKKAVSCRGFALVSSCSLKQLLNSVWKQDPSRNLSKEALSFQTLCLPATVLLAQ